MLEKLVHEQTSIANLYKADLLRRWGLSKHKGIKN